MLVRNPTIFASQVDDEIVMMDEKAGVYFGLNPVAGKIWALLENPLSAQDLVARLLVLYDVSEEQCTQEVQGFLNDMLARGLICRA